MRILFSVTLLFLVFVGSPAVVHAQEVEDAAASSTDQAIAELEEAVDVLYAEMRSVRARTGLSTGEVVVIGVGAGVGYIIGSAISGGMLVPATAYATGAVGLEGAGATVAMAVDTIGTWVGTVAGAVVGDSWFN